MSMVLINNKKGFVEIVHDDKIFHLGQKPAIMKDHNSGSGIYLFAFDFWIHLQCQDEIIVNDRKLAADTVDQIIITLFKQVFN